MKTYRTLLIIIMILLLAACNYSKNNKNNNEIIYDFGVISTISNKDQSTISYYTFDGELVKRQNIKLAWLGISFGSFGETNKFIYTKVHNKNGTVFALNKTNGDYKLYDLSYNPLTMFAEDDVIYLSNSNTRFSTISRFNVIKEELKEIEIEESITRSVYPYKNNLYVSLLTKEGESYIYILDKDTLKIKDRIKNEISETIFHIHGINDKVYFANSNEPSLYGKGSNILTEYDINSQEFEYYDLDYDYLYDVKEYKDSLIITHLNPPTSEGKNVTVFNLHTKEIKSFTLENDLKESAIKDDKFLSCDKKYMYIYNLPDFTLINKIDISVPKQHVTTLFTK